MATTKSNRFFRICAVIYFLTAGILVADLFVNGTEDHSIAYPILFFGLGLMALKPKQKSETE